jgi:hypothetical protein
MFAVVLELEHGDRREVVVVVVTELGIDFVVVGVLAIVVVIIGFVEVNTAAVVVGTVTGPIFFGHKPLNK